MIAGVNENVNKKLMDQDKLELRSIPYSLEELIILKIKKIEEKKNTRMMNVLEQRADIKMLGNGSGTRTKYTNSAFK